MSEQFCRRWNWFEDPLSMMAAGFLFFLSSVAFVSVGPRSCPAVLLLRKPIAPAGAYFTSHRSIVESSARETVRDFRSSEF
jgi:hypothetical protein